MAKPNRSTKNNATLNCIDTDILKGLVKHPQYTPTITTIDDVRYDPAALATLFEDIVRLRREADSAHGIWRTKVQQRQDLERTVRQARLILRDYVRVTSGSVAVLCDFGFTPKKPRRKPTVVARWEAAEKRRATLRSKAEQAASAGDAQPGEAATAPTIPAPPPPPDVV